MAASDHVYEILKQRVIGGTYAPAAQLKEEHLARELGISRTPVRAALKRLVDDGLATADPGRGVRVAQWTEADIEEVPDDFAPAVVADLGAVITACCRCWPARPRTARCRPARPSCGD